MNMTRTLFSTGGLLLATTLALGLSSAARAGGPVAINYSLGAFTFNAPTGDASFELAASPSVSTLTLMPEVAQTVNIQAIYFTVYPTTNADDFTGNLSRSLTLNGITKSAIQGYDLTTDYPDGVNTLYANDSLTLSPGNAFTFDLGSQGTVKFTPQVIDTGDFFNEDSNPDGVSQLEYVSNVKGTFLLTPAVPEASITVSFGVLLALGLGAFALQARKRSQTP